MSSNDQNAPSDLLESGAPAGFAGAASAGNVTSSASSILPDNLFKSFFVRSDLGLAITGPDGTWKAVNPALCRMLGRDENDLRQRSWQQLTHPGDLQDDLGLFQRVWSGELNSYKLKKRFVRKDGSTLHAQLTAAVQRSANGKPLYFFKTLLDRGADEATLEALRLSERRFRLLTESTLDGVWDWDIVGDNLWLSPSWKAQLGFSDQELENSFTTWDKLLHPEDHPRVMQHLERYLAQPAAIWQETFRLRHRDGGWRQILARAIPVFRDGGPPTQMVGVHVDITAEREALAELQALSKDLEVRLKRSTQQAESARHELDEERQFVNAILNTAQAVILVLNPQAQVVSVNPYIEKILGWEPRQLVGKNWITTCLPEASRADVSAVFREALTQQRTCGYENAVLARDGSSRHLRWYDDVILDDAGEPRFLVAVGIDVTKELKASEALSKLNLQLEEKVRERTRALEAAQATLIQNEKMASIGTMVGGISHELNNPLMALTNYVDYAREYSTGRTAEVLDKAAAQVRRIGKIVDGLLTFTRPTNTRLEPIDIASTLSNSIELLRLELERHGIVIDRNVPKDLPPALAEATSLQQALINLLTNARDALAEQEQRLLKLRGGASNAMVWVEVADSGPGIAADIRERVFDPFFTTKEPGKGTGLGLSVAQGIVRALGGTLTLEDQNAPGAVFRISLPRADLSRPG